MTPVPHLRTRDSETDRLARINAARLPARSFMDDLSDWRDRRIPDASVPPAREEIAPLDDAAEDVDVDAIEALVDDEAPRPSRVRRQVRVARAKAGHRVASPPVERPTNNTAASWWTSAPRDGLTAHAVRRQGQMSSSREGRRVNGARILDTES